jgi:hypothetical protein
MLTPKTAIALALLGIANTAPGQWTVTILGEPFGPASTAGGVFAGQQVGDYAGNACLWNGTAASRVDLHLGTSGVADTSGTQQVGSVVLCCFFDQACMWSGTAESFVNLNPPGAGGSEAYGVAGNQQVGYALVGGNRAGFWTGSAESWISLHPAVATSSEAFDTSGNQQVGMAHIDDQFHASLWSGSATSWVDLHPRGQYLSVASCISDAQQAGFVTAAFQAPRHAALWSGTAASYVDLHPAGAQSSEITGASGNFQVGLTTIDGRTHASLWSGSAASWIDLGAFLPAGFFHTHATDVWSDGTTTYIVGGGIGHPEFPQVALLWTLRISTCPADTDGNGFVNVSDLLAVIAAWGPCPAPPTPCPSNVAIVGDSINRVDVADLLAVIAAWGPCP